jgi:hypothetical protein
MLHVPANDIEVVIQDMRDWGYKPVLEEEAEK